MTRKFFAVRVVLADDNGSTYSRDYVRGEMRLGKQAFTAYAVGDFIGLVSEGTWAGFEPVGVTELYPEQVIANRKYQHTTH